MTNKIILLFTLLAYSMIVSQSFMYMLSLKHVQLNLEAAAYTEVRKLTDISMRGNFKYVIYAALLLSVVLMVLHIKNPGGAAFITAAIAFAALVIDTLLTVKGSLPVNDIINSWTAGNIPASWTELRDKWFTIFQYRQIANITGFVSLLIGTMSAMK